MDWHRVWSIVSISILAVVLLLSVQPQTTYAAACGQHHVVQRGENLFRIAKRYGTTYQTLQRWNGISNPNHIYVGQRLCVAAGSNHPNVPVEPTEVTQVVALTNLRVRSGPGTAYGIIGRMRSGEIAQVTGINPDHSWWRIQCTQAAACWISANPHHSRPDGGASTPVHETGEAVVESLTVQVLESYPVQVQAVVRGYLPDACAFIESVGVYPAGNTFRIRMTTARHANLRCAQMITPFEEVVALSRAGLPAGEYDVRINDLRQPFTIPGGDGSSGGLIPVQETNVRYVMAEANVRMRSGPGLHYPIIGGVADGQVALVTGLSEGGDWWRVICPDDSVDNCFVSADPSLTRPYGGL